MKRRNNFGKSIATVVGVSALFGATIVGLSFIPSEAWAGSYGFASKAEDAAHTGGDTGLPAWGVVNLQGAARTGADGDYSTIATTKEGYVQTTPAAAVSFAASTLALTPFTSVQDLAELRFASSGKVIHVRKVYVTYTTASGSLVCPTRLIKHSTTQTSGGTSADITACQLDSSSAAPTAVLRTYSVIPTAGTGNTIICEAQIRPISAATAPEGYASRYLLYDAGQGPGIVLRSTNESMALNFAGTIPPNTTPKITMDVEWSEEQ